METYATGLGGCQNVGAGGEGDVWDGSQVSDLSSWVPGRCHSA